MNQRTMEAVTSSASPLQVRGTPLFLRAVAMMRSLNTWRSHMSLPNTWLPSSLLCGACLQGEQLTATPGDNSFSPRPLASSRESLL